MHFDFPIETIKFDFEHKGTGQINLYFNNKKIEDYLIEHKDINKDNSIRIQFNKNDPADESSYAILKQVTINGFNFIDSFKTIPYHINKSKHKTSQDKIANNLYFGYIGEMEFNLTHKNDLLTKAAWIIANNEFEYVKLPLKGDNYREKNLHNILRDTKYMFTGALAPNTKEIVDSINSYSLQDLRLPLKTNVDIKKIQNWINQSSRITFENFDSLPHFTYTNGIVDCLNSFMLSSETLYLPSKVYYFYREVLQDKNIKIKDLFTDQLEENSNVILELPSPWYDNDTIIDKIKEAKNKNCNVALDLTWLPAVNQPVSLDLTLVDQIYFSMNKTWPIQDFRPAFRWSRKRINDAQSFQWDHCTYPKISANVFLKLINEYELDYVYNKYKPIAKNIMKTFDLSSTSVLWYTKHQDVAHNKENPIWPYYFLDDFVCLRKLLDFHGKYFW